MAQNEPLALGAVQKTLLLPLWGRAAETAKPHPQLRDPAAAALVATLPHDFAAMARDLSPVTQLSWVARSLHVDRTIGAILEFHPEATIVNLGCGLDTTFERVDNGRLRWFDIDLPDVIALRRGLIPDSERRRAIAASVLDDSWRAMIAPRDAVLFVAAGLLCYFREDEVKGLLSGLAEAFPGAEMIFDSNTPRALKMAEKIVLAAGGMDPSARLYWGLRRARELEAWDKRIVVVEDYPMFRGMRRGLSLKDRIGTLLSDAFAFMSMVRLRFTAKPA